MIRDALQQIVTAAVDQLVQSNQLPEAVGSVRIEITDTKQPEHGDFACNFALTASKAAGMNPRQLGDMLAEGIRETGKKEISAVEIAGPGFLNFRLNQIWVASFVPQILALGETLPIKQSSNPATQQSINVEFVSVNPNGPITIGSGRGAAYGSTLCNVLEAAGNKVHREYYINDGVNSEQMRLFAESVRAIIQGKKIPARGYKGDYVHAVATEIVPVLAGFERSADLDSDQDLEQTVPYLFAQLDIEQGTKLFPYSYNVEALSDNLLKLRKVSEILGSKMPPFLSLAIDILPFELKNNELDSVRNKTLMALAIALRWVEDAKKENRVTPSFVMKYQYLIRRERLLEEVRRFMALPEDQVLEECKTSSHIDALMGMHASIHNIKLNLDLLRASLSQADEFTKHLLKNKRIKSYQEAAQRLMIRRQTKDLKAFNTTFDTWYSEQSLHSSGVVAREMEQMIASQVADDREIRTVLKLAKGGVIDDVILESQAGKAEVDDDVHGEEGKEGNLNPQLSNQASEQPSNSKTLWLRSAKFGDDMDRVLKRRDGRLTYIASDVAYHKDKLTDASGVRGTGPVDKMITVLGPDHHGYIGRLQAVVAAMLKAEGLVAEEKGSGGSEELSEIEAKIYSTPEERDLCKSALAEAKRKLEVQIFQLVRFVKDGKPAPMRKRDGNIYALIDLMREIGENVKPNGTEEEKLEAGKDVARFFYLMRSHDTTFDFDLDLAQKQSDENPVFYVQYAHARICSVIAKAKEQGIEQSSNRAIEQSLLAHERELTLIRKICDLPYEVQRCAEDYGVHRLATYAIELARTYHHFYDACRVIQPEEPELSRARLALCEATRIALKGTLDLLGISAPNRMERAEAPV